MKIKLINKNIIDEGSPLKVSGDFLDFVIGTFEKRFVDMIVASVIDATEKTGDRSLQQKGEAIISAFQKDDKDFDKQEATKLLKSLKKNSTATIGQISSKDLIDYMLNSPIKNSIIKNRISDKEIEKKIKGVFRQRGLKTVKLDMHLVERDDPQKDYSGLYDAGELTIIVSIDKRLFLSREAEDQDGNIKTIPPIMSAGPFARNHPKVIEMIKIAKGSLPRAARHEVQHFISDLFNFILDLNQKIGLPSKGTYPGLNVHYNQFGVALDPKTGEVRRDKKGEPILYRDPKSWQEIPHELLPVEASTNVEDAIGDFHDAFEQYIAPKLKSLPEGDPKIRDVVNFVLKKFVGLNPDMPANIKNIVGPHIFDFNNVYFKSIKNKNPKLWKWAVDKLVSRY